MLVGYMDPGVFLGGAMTLDPDAAHRAFAAPIARTHGPVGGAGGAVGVYRVAAAQITDLVHEITVERQLEPATRAARLWRVLRHAGRRLRRGTGHQAVRAALYRFGQLRVRADLRRCRA